MRRVIVSEFVSLDGVIEDPGGSDGTERGGWSMPFGSDEQNRFKFGELSAAGALLLGRKTYEGFAAAWPRMGEHAGEYADMMNGYPKHVASATLEAPLEWNNSILIEGDVAEAVGRLKRQDGKDILVFGSGALARTLLEHDLVDECRLMVFPVVVGRGKRLFEDTEATKAMRLASTEQIGPDGVVVLTYEPAGGE